MTEEAKPGGGTSLIAEGTKVVETSVMKDLLGPSAKILGEYLGEHTREFVDKWREQRRKNLSDHERNVATVTGEQVDIFSKPESGHAIERWLTVAIDVPIEDVERSAVYEAVLAEILSSNRGSEFQDVADRLSASGMRLLLNAPSERKILPGPDDRGDFEKLRELGLARKFDLPRFLLLLLAWCIGTGAGLYAFTYVALFLPTTGPVDKGHLCISSEIPTILFVLSGSRHQGSGFRVALGSSTDLLTIRRKIGLGCGMAVI